MRELFLFAILIIITSCQPRKGRITFYIQNSSKTDSLITFKVKVNDKLCVDTLLKYSSIIPNYETIIVDEPFSNNLTIKAITNTGITKHLRITFKTDTYVFLTYVNDFPLTKDQLVLIEKMKSKQKGYNPLFMLEKKSIHEHIQYTKPLLQ